MFVTEEDYKVVIGAEGLKIYTQASPANRERAEAEAIEEIAGYLRHKYDCSTLFSATGNGRNKLIVMYTCDIALYHMSASASARMGAEVRKERYERAIKWLQDLQAGKITADLPLLTSEEDGKPLGVSWGSHKKQLNFIF